jgi:hypothetical protein
MGKIVVAGNGTGPSCVAQNTASFAVRCCADELNVDETQQRSTKSCQALQWSGVGGGRLSICASSVYPNSGELTPELAVLPSYPLRLVNGIGLRNHARLQMFASRTAATPLT